MSKTHWNSGRPVALANLDCGDRVVVDNGFDCIKPWALRTVRYDNGGLFIACSAGRHFLDGQIGRHSDKLKGIRRIRRPK